MYGYTLCFIKQANKVLLLNRQKSRWMGSWNGVGGKIKENETPNECVAREVFEETGIKFDIIKYKGIVNYIVDNFERDIIYVYTAELPNDYIYNTPRKIEEGILDWKEISWILSDENTGIVPDIPKILPTILYNEEIYQYYCIFKKNILVDYNLSQL